MRHYYESSMTPFSIMVETDDKFAVALGDGMPIVMDRAHLRQIAILVEMAINTSAEELGDDVA